MSLLLLSVRKPVLSEGNPGMRLRPQNASLVCRFPYGQFFF